MADLNIPPTIEGLRAANRRLAKLLAKERQRAADYRRERNLARLEARHALRALGLLMDGRHCACLVLDRECPECQGSLARQRLRRLLGEGSE